MKKAFSPKSWLVVPVFLLLSGCGFHTIYGSRTTDNGTSVAMSLNQVAIENIPDRHGQILRNYLIDKMYGKGRPSLPNYTLKITLHNSEEDLGILANATATRTLINVYSDYSLKDKQGKIILGGSAHSVTSYDKLGDQYGTLAAREDAYQRTIDEVSEQIVNRLSLYFSEHVEP